MTDVFSENDKCEASSDSIDRSFLSAELEALNSIYIKEIDVTKEDESFTSVSIDLHPATADNVDQQYVKMTLQLTLSEEYPDDLPSINIRNPRGLSDEKLKSIIEELSIIAEEKKGNSMLFEIIEAAKEHLTSQNRPSGECAICLYGFSEHDIFTRTECYHYFHSHCLARYAKNILENDKESEDKDKTQSSELLCPMCRVSIPFSATMTDEQFPPPTAIHEEMFNLTDDIVELQKKMADLYQKQLEKGGIIDVEAEKNKYLLEISNVPTRSSSTEKTGSKGVENSSEETPNAESDALQSPKDKAKSKPKSTKWNSNENYHGNDGRRRRYDGRYERKPDGYWQNNYGRYQRSREGHYRNTSSRTASQDHYSKKESNQLPLESEQPPEEHATEANGPLNKNSDASDSVKPKYSNYSEGKYNYNRNPRFNQRGRYNNRYNNYSNNSSDYSYNRNRRYNDPNGYYKFNYRNRKSPQNNDQFENQYQDDLGESDVNQKSSRNVEKMNNDDDHKFQHRNEKANDSARNSSEKYSNSADPKKEQNVRRNELSSQRTPQKSVRSSYSDNVQGDLDKSEVECSQESKTNPHRRVKKYSNYNSGHGYDNDAQYHDNHDYNRGNRYQRNPNKYNNQGQYSSQNGSYRNYNSEKWKNREYQKKMSETDAKREVAPTESESQKKEPASIEHKAEPSQNPSKGGVDKPSISEIPSGGPPSMLKPPPGFANPASRVHYGLQAANPPPGFSRS